MLACINSFSIFQKVGKFTYTSDLRFQAVHLDNSDDWSLQISYPKKKDAGVYECQVSYCYLNYLTHSIIIIHFFQVATMPKISLFIELNVVGKNVFLLLLLFFNV